MSLEVPIEALEPKEKAVRIFWKMLEEAKRRNLTVSKSHSQITISNQGHATMGQMTLDVSRKTKTVPHLFFFTKEVVEYIPIIHGYVYDSKTSKTFAFYFNEQERVEGYAKKMLKLAQEQAAIDISKDHAILDRMLGVKEE